MTRLGLLSAMLLAVTTGCGSTPTTRYYTLSTPGAASDDTGAISVGVEVLAVSAPYDRTGIAYRPPDAEHELAFYHYHHWAASPGALTQRALAEALDALPGLAAKPLAEGQSPPVVVGGRVLRLEEVDRAAGIVVLLDLELWRRPDDTGETLSLRLEEPVSEQTVEAVVAAFARALRRAAEAAQSTWWPTPRG